MIFIVLKRIQMSILVNVYCSREIVFNASFVSGLLFRALFFYQRSIVTLVCHEEKSVLSDNCITLIPGFYFCCGPSVYRIKFTYGHNFNDFIFFDCNRFNAY